MFSELQKAAMRKIKARIIILGTILVVLLALFGPGFIQLIQGPRDMYDLSVDELKGAYVEGEIAAIVNLFAEYTETSDSGRETTVTEYYIVPVGDAEFFGVGMKQSDFSKADKIRNDTFEYLMGERDELTDYMYIKGTVKSMGEELDRYFYEWFEETGFVEYSSQAELEQIALPLVVEPYYIGLFKEGYVYTALAVTVALIVLIVINIVLGATEASTSKIRKFIEERGSTDSLEMVEEDYQNAVSVEAIKIGKHYTFYFKGAKAQILKNDEGLWAFKRRTTHKTNGIKTGTTYELIFYTRDKFLHSNSMRREESVDTALAYYTQNNPQIIVGYSDDLQRCFNRDFNALLEMSIRQEQARAARTATAATDQQSQQAPGTRGGQEAQQSQQELGDLGDTAGVVETAYDGPVARVILHSVGEKPIFVIKAVREILGCGLKEAKDIIDNVPSIVVENVPLNDALAIKSELEGLGATVEVEQAI